MEERKDNIYVYIWEEFNTIYIGRTINPKSRHYQHRHIISESTYQFSSSHHVEHPKMIIIENDLTMSEGIEHEKYWIDYYTNNSQYSVLNKSRGGQTGRSKLYTDEELKERKRLQAKKYYEAHREEKLIKMKKYREEYHNEIRKREKEYYERKTIEQRKSNEILRRILKIERETLKEIQEKRNIIKKEQRRIKNAEKNKEYCKRYYQAHRKSSKPYKPGAKFDHKEYYRKHREELLAKQKEYNRLHRLSNKEKD